MDGERVKAQLESVLHKPIELVRMAQSEWGRTPSGKGVPSRATARVLEAGGRLLFWLEAQGGQVLALGVDEAGLTTAERGLIELWLDARRGPENKSKSLLVGEEERRARLVKDWLFRELEAGEGSADMPETLVAQLGLHGTRIPILLYGEFSDQRNAQYQELKKLLESFFEEELLLIPLQDKEWLMLGSEALLESADGEVDAEAGRREALMTIGLGLYEMLSNEWVGECHLSVHDPIRPARELIPAVQTMREAVILGKTFDVSSNIHLPWQLQLEKLLQAVPERDRAVFVQGVLRRIDHVLDAETQATLEHFFALDCNVSETAKKLYIHRNTLLYRLDKFKQETGLDVRTFGDAVLVKVALLLYKVTKRK